MIIHKLELTSFGKFQDYSIEFSEDFNIIQGDNEVGKTTIHKFIEGMLFGFLDPTKSRRSYTIDHAKYQPKNSTSYRGSMIISVSNKQYRIERNFDKKQLDLTIHDVKNGQDITNELIIHQSTKLPDLAEFIGISYKLYQNTVSISQLLRNTEKDLGQALIERLHNITTTKDESISIQVIQNDLQKSLADIGSTKAKTKPYAIAIDQVNDLEEKIEESTKKYEKSEQLFKEKNHIDKNISSIQEELSVVDHDIHQLTNAKKKEQFFKASQLKKQIENNELKIVTHKDEMSLQEESYDQLINIKNELQYIQQKKTELSHQKEELEENQSKQKEQLADNENFSSYDQSIYQFRDLFYERNNLREDQVSLKKKSEQLTKDFNQITIDQGIISDHQKLEQLKEEKEGLNIASIQQQVDNLDHKLAQYKDTSKAINLLILVISFLLYPLGIGYVLHKKWTKRQIEKQSKKDDIALQLQTKQEQLEDEQSRATVLSENIKEILSGYQIAQHYELSELRRKEEQKIQAKQSLQHQLEDVFEDKKKIDSSLGVVEEQFQNHCNNLGLTDLKTKEEFDRFEQDFNQHKHLQEQSLKTQNTLEQTNKELAKVTLTINDLNKQYHKILTKAKVETIEQFKQGLHIKQQMIQLQKENDQLVKRLYDLTDGISIEEFEKNIDFSLKEYTGSHTHKELEDLQNTLRTNLRTLESEAYELEKDISIIEETYIDVPTLKSMLLKAEKDLSVLRQEKEALELVSTVIDDLSKEIQYEFAPSLNKAISEVMTIITDGKYHDLKIDANTNIKIVDDYLKQLLEAEDFSSGTIDQIYFSMRLGLSNVLFKQQFPYILDDTFVNYDSKRLRNVLHLLEKEQRQILLFTCHKREHSIAKEEKIIHEHNILT